MVDWEVTAKTIYCEDVADEVTIIVYGNGTAKCTGSQKYLKLNKEAAKELKQKSRKTGKKLSCKVEDCSKVTKYRDELMSKQ
jgi:hypothetical protein